MDWDPTACDVAWAAIPPWFTSQVVWVLFVPYTINESFLTTNSALKQDVTPFCSRADFGCASVAVDSGVNDTDIDDRYKKRKDVFFLI